MEQTIQFEVGKELKFENVASFRKKMKHSEIETEVTQFVNYLKESGAQKKGPMISATFAAEEVNGEQVLDMEFMVPIDRNFELEHGYILKEIFKLVNASYTRYIGKPLNIESTYINLIAFLQQNNYEQITAVYNVNIKESVVEDCIIDLYVGINPSIL